jgi:hypothetical protein
MSGSDGVPIFFLNERDPPIGDAEWSAFLARRVDEGAPG